MKVFFDTNVHVAEAIIGGGAKRLIRATIQAKWRVFTSEYVVEEVGEVLWRDLHFSRRLARLTQMRILRRFRLVNPASRARVPSDSDDSPILQAALTRGAHYLVTNDRHLLDMNPVESLRMVSMSEYNQILEAQGLLSS